MIEAVDAGLRQPVMSVGMHPYYDIATAQRLKCFGKV
jgi:hypothetical protein